MTIGSENDLTQLRQVGRLVVNTMTAMARALEPGMTTGELDRLGRALQEREGALRAGGQKATECIDSNADRAE